MPLTVRERQSSQVIAEGVKDQTAREFEGNWYFKPQVVKMDYLIVTDRTYTCPYKGTCFWIDVKAPDGTVTRNVGWVYRNPKPGYEFIQDEIGFYARNTAGTIAHREP